MSICSTTSIASSKISSAPILRLKFLANTKSTSRNSVRLAHKNFFIRFFPSICGLCHVRFYYSIWPFYWLILVTNSCDYWQCKALSISQFYLVIYAIRKIPSDSEIWSIPSIFWTCSNWSRLPSPLIWAALVTPSSSLLLCLPLPLLLLSFPSWFLHEWNASPPNFKMETIWTKLRTPSPQKARKMRNDNFWRAQSRQAAAPLGSVIGFNLLDWHSYISLIWSLCSDFWMTGVRPFDGLSSSCLKCWHLSSFLFLSLIFSLIFISFNFVLHGG